MTFEKKQQIAADIANSSQAVEAIEPSFKIYRNDMSKIPTLKRAFLEDREITYADLQNGFVRLADKTEWKLYVDSQLSEALYYDRLTLALCSFQVHTYGNIVVARLHKTAIKLTSNKG